MVEHCANSVENDGQVVRDETLDSNVEIATMLAKLVDVSDDVVVWHQNRLLVLRHGSKD